jgi:thymidylate kinase
MEDLGELRQQAEGVLQQLSVSSLGRPIFVEFSGTPKSGKSTCIDIVAHFFRRLGYRVLAPTEGASRRTPYYLRDNLVAFNTWSASYALMHVLEGLHSSDEYHLAILDRGLFDALAWFELLTIRDDIDEAKRDRVHEFLLIDNWRSVIDAVFLFRADPNTSLERENQNKLIEEPGRAMNPGFLEELNDAYARVSEKHAADFAYFWHIDTSEAQNTTPQSTAARAAKLILDIFESRIAEGKS